MVSKRVSIVENLALPQFLYVVMKALGKEIFETFKVSLKKFTRVLLKLHNFLPNEGSFMDMVKFL